MRSKHFALPFMLLSVITHVLGFILWRHQRQTVKVPDKLKIKVKLK
ncbi:hypothetical protein [Lactiplantibacillus daowaiensis]|uniref:Uncharacterized protein n=1 Tax=Lactiplantibacillus daowaiensis TaxID=2559918 RepID=A0ABW1RXF8_9LACO|nr:hypothetical protein [Lactiplantibacillus daowaiensis]